MATDLHPPREVTLDPPDSPPHRPYRRLATTLLITLVAAFSVLIAGGLAIFHNEAPRPQQVVDSSGVTMFTKSQLISGQAVYERSGLADYGTFLGNGSYLGPDYTAEALHIALGGMHRYYAQHLYGHSWDSLSKEQQGGIEGRVKQEVRVNRYNSGTDTLTLTPAQVAGLDAVRSYYHDQFVSGKAPQGLKNAPISQKTSDYLVDGDKVNQLAEYFFWGAWISTTNRPHSDTTYTNNWPYEPASGNTMPASAMTWTAISVALLVLGLGAVIWFQRRYDLDTKLSFDLEHPQLPDPDRPITTSQRKTGKYFLLIMLLFGAQILYGELLAHYYIEDGFFGLPIQNLLPFNVAKSWHLQLAIFWIATAWLGAAAYMVPRLLGREPRRQGRLIDVLFYSLIFVVVGSLIGEWLSMMGKGNKGWWLWGATGWEYLELGKVWQFLFIAAMGLWVFILLRGFLPAMRRAGTPGVDTDRTRLTTMLLISAVAIPGFYLASLFILPNSHVTYADYWRWWIVHLWVEGIFECFAVILIGWLMVDLKLATSRSTIRALYFQLILLMGTGVVGIGHHYFWIGDNSIWIPLGACFSALEVVPLCLLVWEAWTHYRAYRENGAQFPYKGTFMFLASMGVWNAVGAGATGFLINAPAINYFEHGTQWTPAHAHAAMAGVYAFFSIAIMLYALRNISRKQAWSEKTEAWIRRSCWALNIGLAGMVFVSLMPLGFIQLADAVANGYWHARMTNFYDSTLAKVLLWGRLPWDLVFTAGVVMLLGVVIHVVRNLKPAQDQEMAESHQQWDKVE